MSAANMTRGFLVLAAIFAAANVWVGDPWGKPYKQWDAQDVRKILSDSPWSKPAEIEHKKKLSLEAPEGAPKVAGVPGEDEEDEQEEKGEKGDDRGRSEKEKKKDDVKFLVRWVSSRTLREASVHGQVLQGRIPAADEDKTVPQIGRASCR